MELISDKKVTARKEHECYFCGKIIKIGEKYNTQFCTDGGEPWTWKYCIDCEKVIHKYDLHKDDWGEGLGTDDFQESVLGLFADRFKGLQAKNFKPWQQVKMLLEEG